MNALGPDGDAAIALIAVRALKRNQDRAARLMELIEGGLEGVDGSTREEATTLAHQIAGSAGTFGYDDASDLARIVMTFLTDEVEIARVQPLVAQVIVLLDGLAS